MIQRPNATIQLFNYSWMLVAFQLPKLIDLPSFGCAETVNRRKDMPSVPQALLWQPRQLCIPAATLLSLLRCDGRVWLKHGDMCGFQKYWSMTWAIWQFCLGWVPRLITTGATSYRQMAQSIQVLGDPGHLLNSPTHPETGAGDCFKCPWCKLASAHSKLGKKHVKRQSSQELAGLDRGVWIKKRKSNHVWKERWAWFLKGTKVAHDCSCKYPCIKKYFWCAAKFVAWLCEELKILSQFSKGEQRDILP